ncbi:hypothetical protein niasHT_026956 [Heterodera trifolii]|uniref:Skp1-related protein n=1 Tax=Heterodera trifolii TaxID=157864 RepID=A0ABD2KS33_9BILA
MAEEAVVVPEMEALALNSSSPSSPPVLSLLSEEMLQKEIPCLCSDGEKVLVRLSILTQCGFFAKMLQALNVETNGLSDDFSFDMTKAEIPAETFKKIVSWMEEHKSEPVPEFEQDPNTYERKWFTQNDFQKNFFDCEFAEVAVFLNAANFLDLQSLFRHATQAVAARIKDRSPDDIREMLNLNDKEDKPLTEEEKKAIREKNVWCNY